ncbi:hypothetical protein [Nonomuraea insulae]|uniref:Uncharacterized protein n=1 Tax=Nonomuraea insulae TaxID=1616787 RepID=A0ABW1CQ55_9ACTN
MPHHLAGLAERASLAGGRLEYGETADGGLECGETADGGFRRAAGLPWPR